MRNQKNTIGRQIVPYRKILDGIIFILRTGCQWEMLPKEYGSGPTCLADFRNGGNPVFLAESGQDY